MEAPKVVAMDGVAWLTSSVIALTKKQFIEKQIVRKNVFAGKTFEQKEVMLSQVWDIANMMENGNGTRTAKKPKKR